MISQDVQPDDEWKVMAEQQGVDAVKSAYMALRGQLNQGTPQAEKERIYAAERLLLAQREYEFLYQKKA